MIILDTNVVSELMRRAPEPAVGRWLDRFPAADVFVTAVTAAELRYGVARLPEGRRKQELCAKVDGLLTEDFRDQVLSFDELAATHYAEIVASRERAGRPISVADAQTAAICRSWNAELATRNLDDFVDVGGPCGQPVGPGPKLGLLASSAKLKSPPRRYPLSRCRAPILRPPRGG